MIEREILSWIKNNLGDVIDIAIIQSKEKNPDLIYTRDWLAGMCMRETGFLISRYVAKKMKVEVIHSLMKGDYSQRPKETEKQYHGFGYWQIDIASYPQFVKSGDWKDPFKTCMKAIAVLEEKRLYLAPKFPNLQGDGLHRAITAAYNCGQGRVARALNEGKDIDAFTHQHDYSKMVWHYREVFNKL